MSRFAQLPIFVAPVPAGEGEQARAASAVRSVRGIISLGATPLLVALAIVEPAKALLYATVLAAFNGSGVLWIKLAQRGYARIAGQAMVAELWLLLSAAAWTTGGLQSTASWFLPTLALVAGSVLGTRSAAATAGLCVATSFGLLVSQHLGWLDGATNARSTGPLFLAQAVVTLVVTGLQEFAVRSVAVARRELTARRHLEQRLLRHQEQLEQVVAERTAHMAQLSTAVERAASAIIITDPDGNIEYANPAFSALTGYTLGEAIGMNTSALKSGRQSPEFYRGLWDQLRAGKEWRGEFHNRRKDGTLTWDLTSISPIVDERGKVTHYVGVKEDITERKRLQEQLAHAAHHDLLTGLPNRSLFQNRLEQTLAISARKDRVFGVMVVDLDGFKNINDTHGHEIGDAVLQQVARLLEKNVRQSDTVARMGGDEFTVLLTDLNSRSDMVVVADSLLSVLDATLDVKGCRCRIGASIGMACFPVDGMDAHALLRQADAAMYAIKRGGKNGYAFAEALSVTLPIAATSKPPRPAELRVASAARAASSGGE